MVQGIDKHLTPKEQCQDEYRKFLQFKDQLCETAWQFLAQVKKRVLPRAQEAKQVVDLIIADWRNVRPHPGPEKIGFDPFAQATETFNPSHWLDVDATPLHSALVACGKAFEMAYTLYNKLSPDERKELFPDGLKP